MTNLIIADNHRMVAEGIARLLPSGYACCGMARTLADTSRLIDLHHPELVLLDIGMPDGDGIDAIPDLLAQEPTLRILILTMYDEAAVIQRALDSGAHGYLLKSADREELILGIDTVARGGTYVCKEAQALLENSKETAAELTQREREILRLIGEGRTMKEIAERLCLGFETVHSYTKSLRQKLGCPNTASLVKRAISQHLI
ncbi:MAG: response regulator transcription factor [Prevotella sp.]|nr:response regulator transcription factor [Prevotella sp.]